MSLKHLSSCLAVCALWPMLLAGHQTYPSAPAPAAAAPSAAIAPNPVKPERAVTEKLLAASEYGYIVQESLLVSPDHRHVAFIPCSTCFPNI